MNLVRVGARVSAPAVAAPAHSIRYGTGSRVFAGLHGWSGSARSFDPVVPFMPDDVSLFSFDQPGFGGTPAPARWSLADLVQPVAAGLHALPPGPITVVGNCAGAIVGLHAALALGPRVERVVLIDPFSHAPWYFSLFDWPLVGLLAYFAAFANPLGRFLTNRGLSPHRNPETDLVEGFETVRHIDNLRYLRVLVRSARQGVRPFAPYTGRVDIVRGERTFEAIRRSLGDWRQIWPHLRDVEIADTGHLPVHESPRAVARAIFETID